MNKIERTASSFFVLFFLSALLSGAAAEGVDKPYPAAAESKPGKILRQDPRAGKLLPVPFIEQKPYECGPAAVAMALRYHGKEADPDAIARGFQAENVAGTFTVDLLIAANRAGMEAHWKPGTLEEIKAEIDAGRPVIVFLNLAVNPLPRRHFAVAAGYVKDGGKDFLVLHSGLDPWLMEPEGRFLRQWKRTGYMMMTMKPKAGDKNAPMDSEKASEEKKN